MKELEKKAQSELSEILEACKDKEVYPTISKVVDLLVKHREGVLDVAKDTIENSEGKAKAEALKKKGAKYVLCVDGKFCALDGMSMAKFIAFVDELGEDNLNDFLNGKVKSALFPALTKVYDLLLMKELSDSVFLEDNEYTAKAIMDIADIVAMGQKKTTRF